MNGAPVKSAPMNGAQEKITMKRRLFFTRLGAVIAGSSLFGWAFPGLARKARAASEAPAGGNISVRSHPLAVPRTNVRSASHG
jgi:hypothetical protein